jgi:TP901 family phage tail tape measure protein
MPGLRINVDTSAGKVEVQKLDNALNTLGRTSILTEKETAKLERRFKKKLGTTEAKKATEQLERSLGLTKREVSGLTAKLKGTSPAMAKFKHDIVASGREITKMKLLFAGIGLAGFAADIIYTGAQFEQVMAELGGVSRTIVDGQVTPSFARLKAKAKEMGETTEFSSKQAAEGMKFLAMAGFNAEQIISAIPEVLDLATAGNLELSEAADIASNALQAMRMPVEDLSKVNDTFIKTITTSNTDIRQMAEAFKYSAPLAAALGYDIQELSSYIGLLGNAGIQGSMAGTQLATAFQRAEEVFEKYGDYVVDGEKQTRNLTSAIAVLEERQSTASEVMDIFDQRGGRAVLAMMGLKKVSKETGEVISTASQEMQKYLDRVRDNENAAKQLADLMRSTTIGAFKELMSTVSGIKLDVFEGNSQQLAGTLRDLTKTIRDNRENLVLLADNVFAGVVKIGEAAVAVASYAGVFFDGWKNTFRGLGLMTAGAITSMDQLHDYDEDDIKFRFETNIKELNKEIGLLQTNIKNAESTPVLGTLREWFGGAAKNAQELEELTYKLKIQKTALAMHNKSIAEQEGNQNRDSVAQIREKIAANEEALKQQQAAQRLALQKADAIIRIRQLEGKDAKNAEEEKLKAHFAMQRLKYEGDRDMQNLINKEEILSLKKLHKDKIKYVQEQKSAEMKARRAIDTELSKWDADKYEQEKKRISAHWKGIVKGQKLTEEQKLKIAITMGEQLERVDRKREADNLKAEKAETQARFDEAKKRVEAIEKYHETVGDLDQEYYDARMELNENERDAHLELLNAGVEDEAEAARNKEYIYAIYSAKAIELEKDIRDKRIEMDREAARHIGGADGFFAGLSVGLAQAQRDWEETWSWSALGEDTLGFFLDEAGSAFGGFLNPLDDNFGDLGAAWESLWQGMAASVATHVGTIAAKWATVKGLEFIGDILGGFDLGNVVKDFVQGAGDVLGVEMDWKKWLPTKHDGDFNVNDAHEMYWNAADFYENLNYDEYPAILQKGEIVVPTKIATELRGWLADMGIADMGAWEQAINDPDKMNFDPTKNPAAGKFVNTVLSGFGMAVGQKGVMGLATLPMTDYKADFSDIMASILDAESLAFSLVGSMGYSTAAMMGWEESKGILDIGDWETNDYVQAALQYAASLFGSKVGGPWGGMIGSITAPLAIDGILDSLDMRSNEAFKDSLESIYGQGKAQEVYRSLNLTPTQSAYANLAGTAYNIEKGLYNTGITNTPPSPVDIQAIVDVASNPQGIDFSKTVGGFSGIQIDGFAGMLLGFDGATLPETEEQLKKFDEIMANVLGENHERASYHTEEKSFVDQLIDFFTTDAHITLPSNHWLGANTAIDKETAEYLDSKAADDAAANINAGLSAIGDMANSALSGLGNALSDAMDAVNDAFGWGDSETGGADSGDGGMGYTGNESMGYGMDSIGDDDNDDGGYSGGGAGSDGPSAYHSGGVLTPENMFFRSDEGLFWGQTNEGVVNRKGMEALDEINKGNTGIGSTQIAVSLEGLNINFEINVDKIDNVSDVAEAIREGRSEIVDEITDLVEEAVRNVRA